MTERKIPWIGRFGLWLYRVRCSRMRDLPTNASELYLIEEKERLENEVHSLNFELQECKSIIKLRELELKNSQEIIERDRLRNEAEAKISAHSIAVAQLSKGKA